MKKIYILTILFALFGISQSWANTANSANNNSDIVDGNIVINAPHATFTLDGDKNIGTNGGNGYSIYPSLPKNTSTTVTLTWTSDPACDFKVTKIEFNAKGYTSNALKAGSCVLDFNGEQKAIGTASLNAGGSFASFSAEGNLSSGMTIVYTNTGGFAATTFDCYLKNVSITYTVTPKGKPSVVVAEPQEVNVTVDLANKQTVDLTSLFAMPEGVPSDFAFGYQVSGGAVDGDNFYANAAGEYTVKARIAAKENCHEASELSDEAVTIVVNRLDQTLSWVDEAAINTNMIIDSEQKIAAVATSGRDVTYTSSNADVLSVDAEGNLKALAEGEATITVSRAQDDQYNAAESISKTFKVRLKDTPFFKPNDFVTLDSCAVTVFGQATIELSYVSDGLDGEFTATPADEEIISITREGNILTIDALKVGTTTLTLTQQENALYYGASQTYKIEVTRLENTIYVNGEAEFAKDLTFDANLVVAFTSDNYEEGAPAFVVEQLSGEEIATYEDGVVTANYREGTATWKVSQAESGNFKAAETIFSVTVKKAAEAMDCYVLEPTQEKSWGTYGEVTYELSDAGTTLYYEIKRTAILGVSTNVAWDIRFSEDGKNWTSKSLAVDKSDQWYEFSQEIDENVRFVKFESSFGAGGNHFVRNVRVTRKIYLDVEDVALELFPEQDGEGTLIVDYSLANGGDLKIACDNDLFTLDSYKIEGVDCNAGKAEIPVHFAAQTEQKTYTANVIIYNDVYSKTVQLSANVRKLTPEITFNDVELAYGQEAAVEATVNVDTLALNVEIVGETDVISLEEGRIVALKAGTAQLKAFTEETIQYNAAEKIVTVTVSKAAQAISWTQELSNMELDQEIQLAANASSGLDVVFESSDSEIAYIDEFNVLHALAGGQVTITAKQAGNDNYEAAEPVEQTIEITKISQSITWAIEGDTITMALNEENLVMVTATSGLEVELSSSDAEIVEVVGAMYEEDEYLGILLVAHKVGSVTITASQWGDDRYQEAEQSFKIIVVHQEPTGLEEQNAGGMTIKVIRNGQVYILRNNKSYNMSGQRVE